LFHGCARAAARDTIASRANASVKKSEITTLNEDIQDPVVVPHTDLAAEVLRRVVESFVLREGTEYGEKEFSLEQKVAQVMRQLDVGEAHIVFDPNSESVDLITSRAGKPRG
jgi:uncharacterized protein YheU (UPF0270 family)